MIRPAQSIDKDSILSFDLVGTSDPRRVSFLQDSIKAGECFVSEKSGAITGYGILNYRFFGCGFVALLVVHSSYRRQGVGSVLMGALERECRHQKLFTSTNRSNLPMQALLEKIGYIRSGTIENLDEDDPELVYYKRLSR